MNQNCEGLSIDKTEIESRVENIAEVRKKGQYGKASQLRRELFELGVSIKDQGDQTFTWYVNKKNGQKTAKKNAAEDDSEFNGEDGPVKLLGDTKRRSKQRRKNVKNRLKNIRFESFANWLEVTYGREFLCSGNGLVDVAGGKGRMALELCFNRNIPTVVVDPKSMKLSDFTTHRIVKSALNSALPSSPSCTEETKVSNLVDPVIEVNDTETSKAVKLASPKFTSTVEKSTVENASTLGQPLSTKKRIILTRKVQQQITLAFVVGAFFIMFGGGIADVVIAISIVTIVTVVAIFQSPGNDAQEKTNQVKKNRKENSDNLMERQKELERGRKQRERERELRRKKEEEKIRRDLEQEKENDSIKEILQCSLKPEEKTHPEEADPSIFFSDVVLGRLNNVEMEQIQEYLRSIGFGFHKCLFESGYCTESVGWNDASMVIGMHPDEATELIVDEALKSGKPFAVVPCCVFPSLFPDRKLEDGSPVRTYEQFITYLLQKHPSIQKDTLADLGGSNVILYTRPSSA